MLLSLGQALHTATLLSLLPPKAEARLLLPKALLWLLLRLLPLA